MIRIAFYTLASFLFVPFCEAATVAVAQAPVFIPTLSDAGLAILILLICTIAFKKLGKKTVSGLAAGFALFFAVFAHSDVYLHTNPSGDVLYYLTPSATPTSYTLKNVSTSTTYSGSVNSDGDFKFQNVPAGLYYLITTIDSQSPKMLLPIADGNDSIQVGTRLHADSRDVDGDSNSSEHTLSGYISSGNDFSSTGNVWGSTGTSSKISQRIHARSSTVDLPTGLTLSSASTNYTYFDTDGDLSFGGSGDISSTIDIDDDMHELETALNRDLDGNGSIEKHDDDIDGDGTDNGKDNDVDGDGTTNVSDSDVDGDGTSNGSDSDVDGDGTSNGSDDDIDGDEVSNGSDSDVDGDGTSNGSDTDDDGDGISDSEDSNDDGDNDEDGDDESHYAGTNCLTSGCHTNVRENVFSVAGTVYTNNNGTTAQAGATIRIKDANGNTFSLTSDSLGNFYSQSSITAPFQSVTTSKGTTTMTMVSAATGACNASGCHSSSSTTSGRIYVSQ